MFEKIRAGKIVNSEFGRLWKTDRFIAIFSMLFSTGATLMTFGPLLDLALGMSFDLAVVISLVIGPVVVFMLTNMYQISVYRGIPNTLVHRAREYYSLNKSQRSEYPKGVVNILREGDSLSFTQGAELDVRLRDLYRGIIEREKARNIVKEKHLDISGVLEELDRARAFVKSDTETYKEYL